MFRLTIIHVTLFPSYCFLLMTNYHCGHELLALVLASIKYLLRNYKVTRFPL